MNTFTAEIVAFDNEQNYWAGSHSVVVGTWEEAASLAERESDEEVTYYVSHLMNEETQEILHSIEEYEEYIGVVELAEAI